MSFNNKEQNQKKMYETGVDLAHQANEAFDQAKKAAEGYARGDRLNRDHPDAFSMDGIDRELHQEKIRDRESEFSAYSKAAGELIGYATPGAKHAERLAEQAKNNNRENAA